MPSSVLVGYQIPDLYVDEHEQHRDKAKQDVSHRLERIYHDLVDRNSNLAYSPL